MNSSGNNRTSPTLFISCGIFREELEYLQKHEGLDWNVVFLDAALHVNFDKLKRKLIGKLEQYKTTGAEIKVIYGHCHPDIMEILERYGAKKIKAGNCIEAIVGTEELRKIESEAKAFFLTAGWVNNWEDIFALGEKDLHLDFASLFGNYKRIILFDTGVIPIDMGKVEKFSKFARLPVERRKVSLNRLLSLINSI